MNAIPEIGLERLTEHNCRQFAPQVSSLVNAVAGQIAPALLERHRTVEDSQRALYLAVQSPPEYHILFDRAIGRVAGMGMLEHYTGFWIACAQGGRPRKVTASVVSYWAKIWPDPEVSVACHGQIMDQLLARSRSVPTLALLSDSHKPLAPGIPTRMQPVKTSVWHALGFFQRLPIKPDQTLYTTSP